MPYRTFHVSRLKDILQHCCTHKVIEMINAACIGSQFGDFRRAHAAKGLKLSQAQRGELAWW